MNMLRKLATVYLDKEVILTDKETILYTDRDQFGDNLHFYDIYLYLFILILKLS